MIIYGTAVLAISMLLGKLVGEFLGLIIGVDANVGGVGFAMILLIFGSSWMRSKGLLPKATEQGVMFWSAMYIPVVVAMATIQNVAGALSEGPVAILAGLVALAAGLALVPLLSRVGGKSEPLPPLSEEEAEEVRQEA